MPKLPPPDFRYTFAGVQAPFAKAKVVFLPLPFDGATSYGGGARNGPQAIIMASRFMEFYDHELDFDLTQRVAMHTLPEVEPILCDGPALQEQIGKISEKLAQKKKFVVGIGGDHSLTPALVKPHAERLKSRLTVLQLDAHTDLGDVWQGTKWSHWTCMRRCLEMGVNVVHVGVRNHAKSEVGVNKKENIFFAPEVPVQKILGRCTDTVYLTIDVDAFDPSVIPGTGTPEPGGLSWYPVVELLRAVAAKKKVVGFDLMEFAPIPGMRGPDFTCARLIYKTLSFIHRY